MQRHSFPATQVLLTCLLMLVTASLMPLSGAKADGGDLMKLDIDKETVIPAEQPEGAQVFTEGNLVVKLVSPDSIDISVINDQFGTTVDRYLANLHLYLLDLPAGGDPEMLASDIDSLAWVEYAHPNYMTDPLNPVQGSYPFPDLQAVGDFDGQTAAQELQLTDVHLTATGAGVVVGVLDGGVDYTHPELSGRVSSGWDYVDEDPDAMDEVGGDNSGHGTFVAGVISLIAPDASIRAYRVADVDGTSDGYVLAEAIMQAVDDGCDIINLSLAMMLPHAAVGDAMSYARTQGVLVVAAAGNGNVEEVRYPAADNNAIAVAAVDSLRQLAEFSNFGGAVDVCAPGAQIYSPYMDGFYAWWDGTSFAAPFVAGQAALLHSLRPGGSAASLESVILATATDLTPTNPGMDGKLGAGLIDPMAAVTLYATTDSAWAIPDTLRFTGTFGLPGSQQRATTVFSTNTPATFEAALVDTGSYAFAFLADTAGVTGDSSLITAVFDGAPGVGTYYNAVRYTVTGVAIPVTVTLELTMVGDTLPPDSAWTEPETISASVLAGSAPFERCVVVRSTNEPAMYSGIGGAFTAIIDSVAQTGDSACIIIDPTGLKPGTYCDTVVFDVSGINQPAYTIVCLTVTPNNASSEISVIPDTLFLNYQRGEVGPFEECVTVSSDLGDVSFTVTSGDLVEPVTPGGTTNGSFCLNVYPERGLVATLWIDELYFTLDGTGAQDTLVVWIDLDKQPYTNPHSLEFSAEVGTEMLLSGCVTVHNDGPSQPFTGSVVDGGLFTTLIDTTGISSAGLSGPFDSVCLQIDPTGLDIGTYVDTVLYSLDNVLLPAVLPVTLTITPPDTGGADTVSASPPSFMFQATEGMADTIRSCVTINYNNGPAPYTAFSLDPWQAPQLWLLDSVGVTGDSLCFQVNGVALAPGIYCDTIAVAVQGVNGLTAVSVCLEILPDTSGGGTGDTIAVFPDPLTFTIAEGGGEATKYFTVTSANQPASYTVGQITMPPGTIFTGFGTSGVTPDSVPVSVAPGNRGPGQYCEQLAVAVTGIPDPYILDVCLTVVPDSSAGEVDSAWAVPPDVFLSKPEGAPSDTLCFTVFSTNEPADYSLIHDTDSFLQFSGPEPMTGTAQCAGVMSSGLPVGVYCDTLWIQVDGVADPVVLPVCLQITPSGGDTLSSLPTTVALTGNYPNPFNPETNIAFTLPTTMNVELTVYNVLGQRIATLVDGSLPAGPHTVMWNGRSDGGLPVASGIYFYRLTTEISVQTRKMLLLK